MHFYAWSKGLKTGIYYLRTKPVAQAQQFTIEPTLKDSEHPLSPISTTPGPSLTPMMACRRDNPECEACGS